MSLYVGIDPSIVTDVAAQDALHTIDTFLRDQFRSAVGTNVSVTIASGGTSAANMPTTETVRVSTDVTLTAGSLGLTADYNGLYEVRAGEAATTAVKVRLYVNGLLVREAQAGFTSGSVSGTGDLTLVSLYPVSLNYLSSMPTSGTQTIEIRDLRVGGAADTEARYMGSASTPGTLNIIEYRG